MTSPSASDLPIQEATLDLIRWFIPILHRLPRQHRHGLDQSGHTLLTPLQFLANLYFSDPDHALSNQPDNVNNNVGFRVVCLPQHPSRSELLEGIPTGVLQGSRPAPVIGDSGSPGLPRAGRRQIRTAPGGVPPAHGPAIGAGSTPFFLRLP